MPCIYQEKLSGLNDGGFFIDTRSGDVLVCDCDNVAADGDNFGIGGMPGFMAPEVVRGIAKPMC